MFFSYGFLRSFYAFPEFPLVFQGFLGLLNDMLLFCCFLLFLFYGYLGVLCGSVVLFLGFSSIVLRVSRFFFMFFFFFLCVGFHGFLGFLPMV